MPGSGRSPGEENPTSVFFSWKISWTEESVRLQFKGLQRVEHHWATNTFSFQGWFKACGKICMHKLHASITPFYIRDLSICGFWYSLWTWNQSPTDTKGHRVYCCDLKHERSFISWKKLDRSFISCVV